MKGALESLLAGTIDYAGLFPPAKLEIGPALTEFRSHLDGPESVLVNRFVCPANALERLSALIRPEDEFALSVVGAAASDLTELNALSGADLAAIERFEANFEGKIEVDGYETRLPVGANIEQALRILEPFADREAYLEIPLGDGVEDRLFALAESGTLAAKARTGGLTPGSHPSATSLAAFLRECLDLVLPFKLTAGLHHARPFPDPVSGDMMHGFLNVFYAAALAAEEEFSRNEIRAVLEEREAIAFTASDTHLGWRGHEVAREGVDDLRQLFAGFGSCSVNEPVAELMTLGLW